MADHMDLNAIPRLASDARVERNNRTGEGMLVSDDISLALDGTGVELLELCDGRRSLADVISELARRYDATPAQVVEGARDVISRLQQRNLLQLESLIAA